MPPAIVLPSSLMEMMTPSVSPFSPFDDYK